MSPPPEIRAALDTSVVVRLLTGQPQDQFEVARDHLAEVHQAGARVFVSNLVVMEAYFACQHHYRMDKGSVIDGLCRLLSLPTFVTHPSLLPILATDSLATAKPGLLDQLIHAEAIAARLPLVTFEKSASRLPQTHVLPSSSA